MSKIKHRRNISIRIFEAEKKDNKLYGFNGIFVPNGYLFTQPVQFLTKQTA